MGVVKSFAIKKIKYNECLDFCRIWHYSRSCPAGIVYFGLFDNNNMIGVICYGEPAMRNQKKCYNADIELRRLCCIDNTPKNTESYFIGNTLKIIKLMGFKKVISLADPEFGHSGVIYRASNFLYSGLEQGGGSREIIIDGENFHSRTAYAKFGASGLKKLKELFPNKNITVRNKRRKHVYLYEF